MKNDLYQFISTISLLYLCFFNGKKITLDYFNSLNPLTYYPKRNTVCRRYDFKKIINRLYAGAGL